MAKSKEKIRNLRDIFNHDNPSVLVINLITLYRIVTFPVLLLLIFTDNISIFKWLLLASFLTDAVDGFLARKFKVASVLGAKLDSIGDDLTIVAAVVGLFYTRPEFIKEHWVSLSILLFIFLVQLALALFRYKKISSFHTYLAKTAAVVSAAFLLSTFFFDKIYYPLFYLAVCITGVELIEEIILVLLLPKWTVNVKGLYWVLTKRVPTKTAS